ncbi:transposable element Tcb2 transposase [Trichonephila clavipes]|nr:transposable element Tcb2 transposase [Trichonephila clavipes]
MLMMSEMSQFSLFWAKEHVALAIQQLTSILLTDESRFILKSNSGSLLIWKEQRTRYNQSNNVERHNYRGGGIMVWAEISFGGHNYLYVIHGGILTEVRYQAEMLYPYSYHDTSAIGK